MNNYGFECVYKTIKSITKCEKKKTKALKKRGWGGGVGGVIPVWLKQPGVITLHSDHMLGEPT